MFKTIAVLLLALPMMAQANPTEEIDTFAPKNNFHVPVNSKQANKMTEGLFNKILDHVYKVYNPMFTARGKRFIIERDWKDGTANAFAYQRGNNWYIKMFGGLARFKHMTPDGFALVACHEVGHHLGGAPKYAGWASNEGQSDYFATLKCARFIWEKQNNLAIMKRRLSSMRRSGMLEESDKIAYEACRKRFRSAQDEALCFRSALAGKSLGRVLSALGRDPKLPDFNTPDQSKVRRTNNSHPKAQCRLDTYFYGSLCKMDKNTQVDDRDPDVGVCSRKFGAKIGARSRCWYKPTVPDNRRRRSSRRMAAL